MIRPYIKGLEDNSILIDMTDVKNWDTFFQSLHAFNIPSEQRDYIGRIPKLYKHLQRSFVETAWRPDSQGEKATLGGYLLEDGTFIKGFRSLPAEADIVRIKLDRLPLRLEDQLQSEMRLILGQYGQILNLGLYYTSMGCFMGQGYATLNLSPTNRDDTDERFPLRHVIPWIEDGRQVLLHRDTMPAFCRLCQEDDHCRADCPSIQKLFTMPCNCNDKGHIQRNCPP